MRAILLAIVIIFSLNSCESYYNYKPYHQRSARFAKKLAKKNGNAFAIVYYKDGIVWTYEKNKIKIFYFNNNKISKSFDCPVENSEWIQKFDLDKFNVDHRPFLEGTIVISFKKINGKIETNGFGGDIKRLAKLQHANDPEKKFANDIKKYYIGYFLDRQPPENKCI